MLLSDLPPELLARLWDFFTAKDLGQACSSCRAWAALELDHRQDLWRGLVMQRWPVKGTSVAFAAMGVCWRARYQLLHAECPEPAGDEDPLDVRALLARINAEYTFVMTLTLGGTAIVSTACLELEVDDADEVSNDDLLETGVQLNAYPFPEAQAATLDFDEHAPSLECFVQRADGKVAILFRLASETPWRKVTPSSHAPDVAPYYSCVHEASAPLAWIKRIQRRTLEDYDTHEEDDVLHAEFEWNAANLYGEVANLYATLRRGLAEDSEYFDGREGVAVHDMQDVLSQHLVWV
jgi:hypothetical protein